MKINFSSPLAELSKEDHATLITWLERNPVKDVINMVARPKPEGFGIKTHITTLRRFYARYEQQQRQEDYELAKELSKTPPLEAAAIREATIVTLQKRAFDMAITPNAKLGQFKALTKWCTKLCDHEHRAEMINITKEKLALDRTKFEFNAARAALLHFKPLQKIAEDKSLDDESKIRAAREAMFGTAVSD
jgi:hypothetical protein